MVMSIGSQLRYLLLRRILVRMVHAANEVLGKSNGTKCPIQRSDLSRFLQALFVALKSSLAPMKLSITISHKPMRSSRPFSNAS